MKRKNKIMWAVRDENNVNLFMEKPTWTEDDACSCGNPGCVFGGTSGWDVDPVDEPCVEEFRRAFGWAPAIGADPVRVRFSVELLDVVS